MPQTHYGAMLACANRVGLSFKEYRSRVQAGLKHCMTCKQWLPVADFTTDKSRHDGLCPSCASCRAERQRTRYIPKEKKSRRPYSAQARANIAEGVKQSFLRGRVHPLKGKERSIEERQKISATVRRVVKRGSDSASFKDGKYAERMGQRHTSEYKQWRFDVLMRDKFTCQDCGDARGGNLNAHHIQPFSTHPELRFEVSNGITVCNDCHDLRHGFAPRSRPRGNPAQMSLFP